MTDLCLLDGASYRQDPELPWAVAAAISQRRFVVVGDEEIRNLIRPGTRVSDLEDRWVLHGLSDARFHLYDWALGLQRLALADPISLADLRGRLAQRAGETPAGDWILGQGWNETRWPTPRPHTHADPNEVAPQQPEIAEAQVVKTALGGAVVYRR